jgi:hypothetical protein
MKRTYRITVRGSIPDDLVDRISALHAMAYLQSKKNKAKNPVRSLGSSGDVTHIDVNQDDKKNLESIRKPTNANK